MVRRLLLDDLAELVAGDLHLELTDLNFPAPSAEFANQLRLSAEASQPNDLAGFEFPIHQGGVIISAFRGVLLVWNSRRCAIPGLRQ